MPEASTAPASRQVSLSPELARSVEDYRLANRLGSESDAIRALIELGLAAGPRPVRRSVGPEDEARSGPEAIERPCSELDD
jgi:hypothetical protein